VGTGYTMEMIVSGRRAEVEHQALQHRRSRAARTRTPVPGRRRSRMGPMARLAGRRPRRGHPHAACGPALAPGPHRAG